MPVLRRAAAGLDWLPGLASRLTIGGIFIQAGWGKLRHLDRVAEFFASLGIPAPGIQAPFVAAVELACGALVLAGLGARFAAVPLMATMAVAIATARMKDAAGLSDFLSLPEYLLIVLLLWLAVKGAGAVSIDSFLAKRREEARARPADGRTGG